MSKISSIIDLVRSSSKRMQDLGDTMGSATKVGSTSINGRTLAKNLGKYSLLPAAAGVGVGAGLGGGTYVASEGLKAAGENIKETFSLDFSSLEGLGKSTSKLSGWVILAALAALAILVLLPALKGGKKNDRAH